MKRKNVLVLLLSLLLVLSLFTGCGASAKNESMAMDAPAADAPAAAPMEEALMESDLSSATAGGQVTMPENEKLITTMNIEAQTEDMEVILGAVNEKVSQLGGYIEAQEIYNGSAYSSYRYRHAYLTIRIPAEKLNSFVTHVSERANIVMENRETQNITLTYVAVETRLTALETERDRLLELMEMAVDMEDLLLIEQRLTEVVAELEEVTAQLRVYDNKVSYATVNLNLEEVKEYTEIEEEPETVWQRIASGFGKSIRNLGKGLVNFFVFIVSNLPYFVLIGAIAAAVLIVRRVKLPKRKKKEKNDPPA